MVTTRRGWWPAFGPALLAFTVVVCGSVSLLAIAHESVFDDSHPYATTGSTRWTALAAGGDSLATGDSGDDSDEVVDAIVTAPIVLTADDGSSRTLLAPEFGAVSPHGPARLAPRGPPAPAHTTYTQEDFSRDQDSDVIVDDDDHDDDDDYDDDDDDGRDDGGATDLGSGAHAPLRGSSSILIRPAVDALFAFALDNHSLRAPPR